MQPDPDPILALLPDERPAALACMPPAERAWRTRAFILLRGAGYPSPMAWWLTMGEDEGFETDARQAIQALGDERIAEIAASLPEGRSRPEACSAAGRRPVHRDDARPAP